VIKQCGQLRFNSGKGLGQPKRAPGVCNRSDDILGQSGSKSGNWNVEANLLAATHCEKGGGKLFKKGGDEAMPEGSKRANDGHPGLMKQRKKMVGVLASDYTIPESR